MISSFSRWKDTLNSQRFTDGKTQRICKVSLPNPCTLKGHLMDAFKMFGYHQVAKWNETKVIFKILNKDGSTDPDVYGYKQVLTRNSSLGISKKWAYYTSK
ncbi:hypothetical protein MKW98_023458 [Papaver atlanticum]|uniref:Uncharacterized protein n=1 Tax=Papaver atlanticum TaxID=357466 RepID=A0AAD4SYU4_9MAGN|nr:hypothetical protein MKW98_023458 [Papaver atlanticum]